MKVLIDGVEYTVIDEGGGEVSLTCHKAGMTFNLNFVPMAWIWLNGKPVPVKSVAVSSEDYSDVPTLKENGPILKDDDLYGVLHAHMEG